MGESSLHLCVDCARLFRTGVPRNGGRSVFLPSEIRIGVGRYTSITLRAPDSGAELQVDQSAVTKAERLVFNDGSEYPVADGVPILLAEDNPFFDRKNYADSTRSGFSTRGVRRIGRFLPSIGPRLNARRLEKRLFAHRRNGRCLVVGAGDDVSQNKKYLDSFDEVVITDVSVQPQSDFVCDVHQLPFADEEFDFVVCIAVLEHVLDPPRAVAEMHRVLRNGGEIYVNTPFMQQVHMAAFDFMRFTPLGHRWLLRKFRQVEAGPNNGPGSVVAWALLYAGLGFFGSGKSRLVAKALLRLVLWPLNYLDYLYGARGGANDSTGGSYFWGEKELGYQLQATELLGLYKGLD